MLSAPPRDAAAAAAAAPPPLLCPRCRGRVDMVAARGTLALPQGALAGGAACMWLFPPGSPHGERVRLAWTGFAPDPALHTVRVCSADGPASDQACVDYTAGAPPPAALALSTPASVELLATPVPFAGPARFVPRPPLHAYLFRAEYAYGDDPEARTPPALTPGAACVVLTDFG